jgi:hypothetical protein
MGWTPPPEKPEGIPRGRKEAGPAEEETKPRRCIILPGWMEDAGALGWKTPPRVVRPKDKAARPARRPAGLFFR